MNITTPSSRKLINPRNHIVLLVKSCRDSRIATGASLFREGWNVIEADSLEGALEYQGKSFDAVLADQELKDGKGSELASAFQAPSIICPQENLSLARSAGGTKSPKGLPLSKRLKELLES